MTPYHFGHFKPCHYNHVFLYSQFILSFRSWLVWPRSLSRFSGFVSLDLSDMEEPNWTCSVTRIRNNRWSIPLLTQLLMSPLCTLFVNRGKNLSRECSYIGHHRYSMKQLNSSMPDMFGGESCRRLQYRNGTGSWKHARRKWHKRRRWEDWQLSRTAWEGFLPSSPTPMNRIASALKPLCGQWPVCATHLFIIHLLDKEP